MLQKILFLFLSQILVGWSLSVNSEASLAASEMALKRQHSRYAQVPSFRHQLNRALRMKNEKDERQEVSKLFSSTPSLKPSKASRGEVPRVRVEPPVLVETKAEAQLQAQAQAQTEAQTQQFFKKDPFDLFKSSRLDYAEDERQRVNRIAFSRLGLLKRYAPHLFDATQFGGLGKPDMSAPFSEPINTEPSGSVGAPDLLGYKPSSHRPIKTLKEIREELLETNNDTLSEPVNMEDDGGLGLSRLNMPRYSGLDSNEKPPPYQAPPPAGKSDSGKSSPETDSGNSQPAAAAAPAAAPAAAAAAPDSGNSS